MRNIFISLISDICLFIGIFNTKKGSKSVELPKKIEKRVHNIDFYKNS